MRCIINRMSILKRFENEEEPLYYGENERPCAEASLEGVRNAERRITARYFIDIVDIKHLAALTKVWGHEAIVTVDDNFPTEPTIIIYDI